MLRHLFHISLVCLVAMTAVWPAAAAQPRILVVQTEKTGAYAETAQELRAGLRGFDVSSGLWAELAASIGSQPPELVITVGQTAFEQALRGLAEKDEDQLPVLATLLPRSSYQAVLAKLPAGRRPVSAVVLDQPLSRQLGLIRQALPERTRVAVLSGPQTRPQLHQLQREAAKLGLKLLPTRPVDTIEQIYPALREAYEGADVLLTLPDPTIYNAQNLQNILLSSYRARLPLVSFSPAYVKAGALLAAYATPQQVGRAAAGAARAWLSGGSVPPVQAPQEFTVATNPHVAASLGLRIDEGDALADALRRVEGPL